MKDVPALLLAMLSVRDGEAFAAAFPHVIDNGRMVTEGAPRDLIATHIEPHVVEVFGDEAGSWARARSHLGERLEVAGETAFYYCHDTAPLIAALAATSLYNTAGEIAEKRSNGPGSFQVALLDALWNVTAEEVADRAIDMR